MSVVHVLNGPNLNLLGTREPAVYGTDTLVDAERLCRAYLEPLGHELVFLQSNHEGDLVDWVHEAGRAVSAGEALGAVINPGAFTHTSVALRDAVVGVELPAIEVHVSNVHAREAFRHHSYLSPVAAGVVIGVGILGYELGLRALVSRVAASR